MGTRFRGFRLLPAIPVLAALLIGAAIASALEFGAAGSGAGQTASPRGLAVDFQSGRTFVADSNNHRIDVFDSDGDFVLAFGWGVATGQAVLQSCGPGASPPTAGCLAGVPGSGSGQLNSPTRVAVDNDPSSAAFQDVYAYDATSKRVQRFSPSGDFRLAFGSEGGGEEEFESIEGLGVGPNGTVNVIDTKSMGACPLPGVSGVQYSKRIQKFTPNGDLIEAPIVLSDAPCGGVRAFASDSGGNFYVGSDGATGAVRKYDPDGTPLYTVDPSFNIGALAVDSADNLFVGDVALKDGDRFNPTGARVVLKYDSSGQQLAAAFGDLKSNVTGLAADPAGTGGAFAAEGSFGANRILQVPMPPPGPVVLPGSTNASDVGSTKATLNAEINSEGKATTFHFEYVDQESFDSEGGFSSPSTVATAESSVIGSDFFLHDATHTLPPQTLTPATTYRFRVVAKDSDGVERFGEEAAFATFAPLEIGDSWATDVGTESARLHGIVNPLESPATGYFEYVEQSAFEHSGFATASQFPNVSDGALPIDFGAGEAPVKRSIPLTGLRPGMEYRYRLRVGNPFLSVPVFGPERTFTTFALPGAGDSGCPNQAFRTGPAAALPDCRAYELVSPLDKEGGDIFSLTTLQRWRAALEQSAGDGESFTYSSYRSFGGADSAPFASQYLASRTPAGWTSEPLSPPRAAPSLFDGGEAQRREFKAFSPDLRSAWLVHDSRLPLEPEAPAGYAIPYSRTGASAEYEALIQVTPPGVPAIKFKPELQGLSADGSKAVFRAPAKLTPSASSAVSGADSTPINQTYMSIGGGALRLVSILPDGKASDQPSSAGAANDRRGDTGGQSVAHAVSDDGTRVWWTTGPNADAGGGALYLRVNADKAPSKVLAGECTEAAKACTLEVSGVITDSPARFQTASADGARVIFSVTGGPLAGDLYEADFSDPSAPSTRLIAGGLAGGSEGGLLGAGDDAKRIYFASEEVLDAGAEPGEPNLYLHDGAETRYVATLSAQDADFSIPGISPLSPEPAYHVAQATADGEQLLFASTGSPTGYDNAEIVSGEPVTEVYRYDATAAGGAGDLECVSCNPSGARPAGHAPLTIHPWQNVWIGSTIKPPRTHFHTPNSLSDDGSVAFFDSYDALVLTDTNGARDVYQWRAPGSGTCTTEGPSYSEANGGCLSLISTGKSPVDSEFLDASPDGEDVFFTTAQSLVSQDSGLIDVYDARIGGGLPPPQEPPPACEGEACLGAPTAPEDRTPASVIAKGAGNVVAGPPPRRRCAKGKVRRRGRCVVRKRGQRRGHAVAKKQRKQSRDKKKGRR